MKIMLIGASGSGKSTFSRELGQVLNIPIFHLDVFFWKPGWVQTSNEEWNDFIKQLVMKEKWIVDGYYGRSLDIRMHAADVIIYFDLSPWITTYRVIKRRIQYHGKTRPDLNSGCPESLDWQFIKYNWRFRRDKRQGIMQKIKTFSMNKKIIIIRHPREARMLIKRIKDFGVSYFDEVENFI